MGLFGIVQVGMDVVWRWLGKDHAWAGWLRYGTLKAAFEPQKVMFCDPAEATGLLAWHAGTFLAVAALGYLAAWAHLERRGLPAPI